MGQAAVPLGVLRRVAGRDDRTIKHPANGKIPKIDGADLYVVWTTTKMDWGVLNPAGGGECSIHLLNYCETKRWFPSVDWCRADIPLGRPHEQLQSVKVGDLDVDHYQRPTVSHRTLHDSDPLPNVLAILVTRSAYLLPPPRQK